MTSEAVARSSSTGEIEPGVARDGLFAFEIRPHNCFACGELNVRGLHLQLHLEPERCWVDLTLERAFEGWEGIAHGGILCTILDEVMAWSLVAHDTWGVTARLAVEFRRPVEVGSRIRAEGWVVDARRRTSRTRARIVDPTGAVLATAEGVYVAAPEGRKRELQERYAFRRVERSGDDTDTNAGTSSLGTPEPVDTSRPPEGRLSSRSGRR